jgi:hypothetical protein
MSRKSQDISKVLKYKVTGLKDVEGNVLNMWTYRNYDQFREFFAQETENFFNMPIDSILMDKGKPIFDDQPIIKPDDFEDYWMNTPLKTPRELSQGVFTIINN